MNTLTTNDTNKHEITLAEQIEYLEKAVVTETGNCILASLRKLYRIEEVIKNRIKILEAGELRTDLPCDCLHDIFVERIEAKHILRLIQKIEI